MTTVEGATDVFVRPVFGIWGRGGVPGAPNLPGPGEAIKRRSFGLKLWDRAEFMQIYPKMSESENRVGLIYTSKPTFFCFLLIPGQLT